MTRRLLDQPLPAANRAHIGPVVSGFVRLLKLVVFTLLGFALLILGIVWLVDGIESRHPLSLLGGGLAITVLSGWVIRLLWQSRREARSQAERMTAKLRAGQRECRSCQIGFDEATSLKTPEAWYHAAISVALPLIPVCMGGIGLWALGFASPHSIKLVFTLIGGVTFLFFGLKARSRCYVRCPKCGRSCGWDYAVRGSK